MYELALLDGRVLLTRISHPVNRTTYSRSMWAHILRDQLDVTDDAFWACVDDGVVPARGTPDRGDERSLPLWLVAQLTDAGVPMAELATMSEAQAKSRLAAIWGAPDSGSSPHPELSERGEP